MVDAGAPIRSRRLPFWAMTIALVFSALGGVFMLLWFKLPTWAPAWVVEHSPWGDPIVRAADEDESSRWWAAQRLGGMGSTQVPRLLALIDDNAFHRRDLASKSLRLIRDPRIIQPLFARLLADSREARMWYEPLASQDPGAVADLLMPRLVTGEDFNSTVIRFGGWVDDGRVVARLVAIMEQRPRFEGFYSNHIYAQPTTLAAMSLVRSLSVEAVPALLRSAASPDVAIRRRVIVGIMMNHDYLPSGEGRQLDERLKVVLLQSLTDQDPSIVELAARAACLQPIVGAEPILIQLTRSPDPTLRCSALTGLNTVWSRPTAGARILECIKDPVEQVQVHAIYTSRDIENPLLTGELIEALSTSNAEVRKAAYTTLNVDRHRSDPRWLPAMLRLSNDPDDQLRNWVRMGIKSADLSPEQRRLAEDGLQ